MTTDVYREWHTVMQDKSNSCISILFVLTIIIYLYSNHHPLLCYRAGVGSMLGNLEFMSVIKCEKNIFFAFDFCCIGETSLSTSKNHYLRKFKLLRLLPKFRTLKRNLCSSGQNFVKNKDGVKTIFGAFNHPPWEEQKIKQKFEFLFLLLDYLFLNRTYSIYS